jgi:hypothetical protein
MSEEGKDEPKYVIPPLSKGEFSVLVLGVLGMPEELLVALGKDVMTAQKALAQAILQAEGKLL